MLADLGDDEDLDMNADDLEQVQEDIKVEEEGKIVELI